MILPNSRDLKQRAATALAPHSREVKKLILIHTAAVLALTLALMLINYALGHGIENTGGLSDIGTRAMLTTAQMVLQLFQMVAVPFWQISWLYIILKFSRGNCAATTDLWEGFRRFLPFLRLTLLKGLLFAGLIVAGVYAGAFVFMMTPFAAPLMEAAMSTTDPEAMYAAMMAATAQIQMPMMVIGSIAALALCLPFFYRFRMAEYFLLDNTDLGAMTALRASRRLMRGNAWRMVRLDLSFWWFWLLDALVTVVAYLDMLLPLFDITLPVSQDVSFFGAFVLYIPCQLLLYWLCKPRVDATYAAAFDAVTPPPQPPIQVIYTEQ